MKALIIFLGFFLLLDSDCPAQIYKYVGPNGAVCFTDNPPASASGESLPIEKKEDKEVVRTNVRRSEVKDIMQLGEEALREELAKPPGKQDRRFIQEMKEILYGEGIGRKPRQVPVYSPIEALKRKFTGR